MSLSKKKYTIGIVIFIFLVLFIVFQFIFLKNIFGIDPFAKDILPKGICKDCNVILITLDTLRAKSLPCYGYDKNTAPNLCEFAKKSYFFQNAYSQNSSTIDSTFSIFTSLYPSSHKMTIPFLSNLSDEIITMPQIFKQNGYETLYIGDSLNPHLPLDKGISRGFDKFIFDSSLAEWATIIKENFGISKKRSFIFFYNNSVHEPYFPLKENISKFYDGSAKQLIGWSDWREKTRKKIRLFNSILYCKQFFGKKDNEECNIKEYDKYYQSQSDIYWDRFEDMDIEEKKKLVLALYEAEIFELDLKLGFLFKALDDEKVLDNTIVIITSQHGEEFYEHKNWTHACKITSQSSHFVISQFSQ